MAVVLKHVATDGDETEEKHTQPSTLLEGFSLPLLGVKSTPILHIYFYIQMLWIAPGKGCPFSQQRN